MKSTSSAFKNALENQIRRLQKKTAELEKLSTRISAIRFFDFVLTILLLFLAARSGSALLFWVVLAAGIAIFMGLISWHRTIDEATERFNEWINIRKQHLARISLQWHDLSPVKTEQDYHTHPFAQDFDIVGTHSLMHLIDTTTYEGSRHSLEDWLTQRVPDLSGIKKRQQLVKQLKPMAHFRDRLHLYANLANEKKAKNDWSMDSLLVWLRSTRQKNLSTPLIILGFLSAVNITLLVLYLSGILKPYVIISFILYLCIYNFYGDRVSGLFGEASQMQKLLSKFRGVLLYLESYSYKKDSPLYDFCSVYHNSDQRPSGYLKKIIRIASAASSQSNDILWIVLNMLVPWDMYFAKKLDTFKTELEPRLERWLNTFYELEALNALANFAWINPGYTFSLPQENTASPVLKASDMGHPLIPAGQKVTNNVAIENVGDIQLITGSNMAGKSTFLRTIGINLALCFAGAPVNASSFHTIGFRLFSSINVTDSLDEGLSHFYAEVKRLRALLDQLQQPHDLPLFFMVDEIYRGTNNKERLAGSTAFLKHVAGKDGVGLVSTHDLELARLEEEIPVLSNWHFEETIEDGKMSFEYKLKPGPCPSTNALKIMDMEGLPV